MLLLLLQYKMPSSFARHIARSPSILMMVTAIAENLQVKNAVKNYRSSAERE